MPHACTESCYRFGLSRCYWGLKAAGLNGGMADLTREEREFAGLLDPFADRVQRWRVTQEFLPVERLLRDREDDPPPTSHPRVLIARWIVQPATLEGLADGNGHGHLSRTAADSDRIEVHA